MRHSAMERQRRFRDGAGSSQHVRSRPAPVWHSHFLCPHTFLLHSTFQCGAATVPGIPTYIPACHARFRGTRVGSVSERTFPRSEESSGCPRQLSECLDSLPYSTWVPRARASARAPRVASTSSPAAAAPPERAKSAAMAPQQTRARRCARTGVPPGESGEARKMAPAAPALIARLTSAAPSPGLTGAQKTERTAPSVLSVSLCGSV